MNKTTTFVSSTKLTATLSTSDVATAGTFPVRVTTPAPGGGTSGSLDFMFERKGVFKIAAEGVNVEDLELELIDYGAEDIFVEDGEIYVYTQFSDFGAMQKALEERGLNILSSELQRLPNNTTELSGEQEEAILNLIEKIEDDDDVQAVYHNMK